MEVNGARAAADLGLAAAHAEVARLNTQLMAQKDKFVELLESVELVSGGDRELVDRLLAAVPFLSKMLAGQVLLLEELGYGSAGDAAVEEVDACPSKVWPLAVEPASATAAMVVLEAQVVGGEAEAISPTSCVEQEAQVVGGVALGEMIDPRESVGMSQSVQQASNHMIEKAHVEVVGAGPHVHPCVLVVANSCMVEASAWLDGWWPLLGDDPYGETSCFLEALYEDDLDRNWEEMVAEINASIRPMPTSYLTRSRDFGAFVQHPPSCLCISCFRSCCRDEAGDSGRAVPRCLRAGILRIGATILKPKATVKVRGQAGMVSAWPSHPLELPERLGLAQAVAERAAAPGTEAALRAGALAALGHEVLDRGGILGVRSEGTARCAVVVAASEGDVPSAACEAAALLLKGHSVSLAAPRGAALAAAEAVAEGLPQELLQAVECGDPLALPEAVHTVRFVGGPTASELWSERRPPRDYGGRGGGRRRARGAGAGQAPVGPEPLRPRAGGDPRPPRSPVGVSGALRGHGRPSCDRARGSVQARGPHGRGHLRGGREGRGRLRH
ncbi:unnamed protein product [Prorocentrum cordatum]|uniref:Uncharacterized protein n=1 Tax=Prorocentrum cordatum TaxID=2364126 RepID=A0ABN9TVY9_9DINO|nr:unnamed protein product [Polarella glacialis]